MARFRFFALALCLLALAACGSPEDKAVKGAVKAYNESLKEAYLKPNPDLMADVASEKQQQRVGLYIMNLVQKGQIMKCTVNSLSFGKVKFTAADKAEVDTKESWTYEFLDPATRNTVVPPKNVKYEATYSLVLQQGDWLVDSLKIHKEN